MNYLRENNILNLDDVREQIMKKKNEIYLQQHQEQHKIWFDPKANQWMTYISDSTAKKYYYRNNQTEFHKFQDIERALSAI